jgi:hypothetical protein
MHLGVYSTQELLHTMKKVKPPLHLGCDGGVIENLNHIILHCVHYQNISEVYLTQYMAQNRYISEILDVEDIILLSILDPFSSKLSDTVTKNWVSAKQVYNLSRAFCYNIHRKRTKLYNDADKLS